MIIEEGGGYRNKSIYQKINDESEFINVEKNKVERLYKSSENNLFHQIISVLTNLFFPVIAPLIVGTIVSLIWNPDFSEGSFGQKIFTATTSTFMGLWIFGNIMSLFDEETSIPGKITRWITSFPFKIFDRTKLMFLKKRKNSTNFNLQKYIAGYSHDIMKKLDKIKENKFYSINGDHYSLKISYIQNKETLFVSLYDKKKEKTVISSITNYKENTLSEFSYFQDIGLNETKERNNILKLFQDMIYKYDDIQPNMKQYIIPKKENNKESEKFKEQSYSLNQYLLNIKNQTVWQTSQINRIQKLFEKYNQCNLKQPETVKKINEYLLPEAIKMIMLYPRHSQDKLIKNEIEKTTNDYIDRITLIINEAIKKDTNHILQNSKRKLETHDILEEKAY